MSVRLSATANGAARLSARATSSAGRRKAGRCVGRLEDIDVVYFAKLSYAIKLTID
jgi:hypothetical protein